MLTYTIVTNETATPDEDSLLPLLCGNKKKKFILYLCIKNLVKVPVSYIKVLVDVPNHKFLKGGNFL